MYVMLSTDVSQRHFHSATSRHKPRIDHDIASDIHRILQIALNLVEDVFACTTQHDCACLRALALHQECEVSVHAINDYWLQSTTVSQVPKLEKLLPLI